VLRLINIEDILAIYPSFSGGDSMSVEDIVAGKIKKAKVPEKLKEAAKVRQKRNEALFDILDAKLKKVGDAVSFKLKEGVNQMEIRGPAIRYMLAAKKREGEWESWWDEETKTIYVEKVK